MRWLVTVLAVVLVACHDTDPLPVPPGSGQLPPGGSTQGAPAPGSGGTSPDGGPTVVDMPATLVDMSAPGTSPDLATFVEFCASVSCATDDDCLATGFGCSRCDPASRTCR